MRTSPPPTHRVLVADDRPLDLVWGYEHDGYGYTVNSHIDRLRAKIERNPCTPRYVLAVWGVGYKFRDAEDD